MPITHVTTIMPCSCRPTTRPATRLSLMNRLRALEESVRSLSLVIPTDTTQFTHTPGQVAFSPDGSQLIVTTKANGDRIDVFTVAANGQLSHDPVVNSNAGTVPFAISFDS